MYLLIDRIKTIFIIKLIVDSIFDTNSCKYYSFSTNHKKNIYHDIKHQYYQYQGKLDILMMTQLMHDQSFERIVDSCIK